MLDFDFLTYDEFLGDDRLDIFKKNPDLKAAFMTDFSRLLGNGDLKNEYFFDDYGKFYYFGHWYTKTIEPHGLNFADVVTFYLFVI